MALTSYEESRISTIEILLEKFQTAIANTIPKQEVRQTLLVKQKEIDALTERVAALETQVATLQAAIL